MMCTLDAPKVSTGLPAEPLLGSISRESWADFLAAVATVIKEDKGGLLIDSGFKEVFKVGINYFTDLSGLITGNFTELKNLTALSVETPDTVAQILKIESQHAALLFSAVVLWHINFAPNVVDGLDGTNSRCQSSGVLYQSCLMSLATQIENPSIQSWATGALKNWQNLSTR